MAVSFCGKRIFKIRPNYFCTSKRNNGYIVLVPEIGEDLPDKNPLIHEDGLPEFSNLTIEKCVAAIAKQTGEFECGIRNLEHNILNLKEPPHKVFKFIIEPIEIMGSPLETTWGIAKTMYLGNQTLMPTKSYMSIHDRARRARSMKFNNPTLYSALKSAKQDITNFSEEESRVVNKFVLEGKLYGLDLQEKQAAIFLEILQKLNKERADFKSKVESATKRFKHTITDIQVVRDFPPDLLKSMAVDIDNPNKGPWIATLQPYIYNSFMEYCPDNEIRWNVWQANASRCSGYSDKSLATSAILETIRNLRHRQANLLGYKSYADMSMETKMASSVDAVKKIINELVEHAKPAQEEELKNLEEFVTERGFGDTLQIWDIPYWKRKQCRSNYEYEEDKIREYFPLPKVLKGMFGLCETLFGLKIEQRANANTWHEDVKFYDIFERGNETPISGFYVDPYSRDDEKVRLSEDSGYMVGIKNRSQITDTVPLAALIFNFQSPKGTAPSLLSFRDVHILFQRFGHALQHLLTRTTYSDVAGLSNIEWDAVGICGHVLSHWLYDAATVRSISSHYETEQPLPGTLLTNIERIHTHMAGYDLCQELYLSMLDLELHTSKEFWLEIVKRLWPQFFVLPYNKMDSHPCSFSAIFSDEWGAAYYSHIWSRMIAADVYSAFHEIKGDRQLTLETGKRFRDTFLALGGSCHPNEVFRRFRGRDPSPKALLRSLGLKKVQKIETNVNVIT